MAKYKFDMGVKSVWLEEIIASDCSSGTMTTAYALAWFSDRETGRIRVSHPILAEWTHLNIKTVQRGIQALVDMKKIIRTKKGYSSNIYDLVRPDTDMQTDISGNATEPPIQPHIQPPIQPNLGSLSDSGFRNPNSENEDDSVLRYSHQTQSISDSETEPAKKERVNLYDYNSPLYKALLCGGGTGYETAPEKFTMDMVKLIVPWRDDPYDDRFHGINDGIFRKSAWRKGGEYFEHLAAVLDSDSDSTLDQDADQGPSLNQEQLGELRDNFLKYS